MRARLQGQVRPSTVGQSGQSAREKGHHICAEKTAPKPKECSSSQASLRPCGFKHEYDFAISFPGDFLVVTKASLISPAVSGSTPATMPMLASPTLLLLCAATFALSGYLQAWAAPAPASAPALEPLAISANISGSLGNLCSSQAGVLTLIQGSATNQDEAGLAVSVPANLANAVAVQQIAQVGTTCRLF